MTTAVNPNPDNKSDIKLVSLANEQGDEQALSELLDRYKHLVRSIARTYYLVCGEVEDIIQEGMIGLYKAIRDYREDRRASFRSFAVLCIRRQIISCIRASNRMKHEPMNRYISLDQMDEEDDSNHGDSGNTRFMRLRNHLSANPWTGVEDRVVEMEETESLFRHIREALSPFELRVLSCYLQGDTSREMSAKLRTDKRKVIYNAIQRIRRKMAKYNRQ